MRERALYLLLLKSENSSLCDCSPSSRVFLIDLPLTEKKNLTLRGLAEQNDKNCSEKEINSSHVRILPH